jgi:hypothetical protein
LEGRQYPSTPEEREWERRKNLMVEGQYKVWNPDDGDETDADRIEAFGGPDDAARIWFSDRWAGMDCPRFCKLRVRDWQGQLWSVTCTAERTVEFNADEPEKVDG